MVSVVVRSGNSASMRELGENDAENFLGKWGRVRWSVGTRAAAAAGSAVTVTGFLIDVQHRWVGSPYGHRDPK
jgi:hypothetical protein